MLNFRQRPNPFIVAEMSANHNGSLERALKIIEKAHECGAHAVKIQTYKADTITLNHDGEGFVVKGGQWSGRKLYDLYEEAHTPWEWHKALFDKANELGIMLFSSPFDKTAVDLLEELGNPVYKIASFELVDVALIKYVASKKKPMIMSTGMASLEEVKLGIDTAFANGCDDLTVLHCISSYPAKIEECRLNNILELKKNFPKVKVGLSDHSTSNYVAVAAVALGATLIEKHFTLSRADGGVDSSFSIEPDELKSLCLETKLIKAALGDDSYSRSNQEDSYRMYRRSLYISKDIRKGEKLTLDNVKSVRPGLGLPPKELENIIGKKITKDCKLGTPLSFNLLED